MAARSSGKQRQKRDKQAEDFFTPRSRSSEALQQDGGGSGSCRSLTATAGEAVLESLERLHTKFDSLDRRLTTMEARLAEHDTRMTNCTQEVTAVTARIQSAEQKLETVVHTQDQFKEFQACAARTMVDIGKQVEILSNANKAANVRVLGFPPVSENVDLRLSVEEFFKTVVFGDAAEVRGDVKRVTRLATKGPDDTASVRGTVLAVLRVADDRDSLLRAASRKEGVFFQGARILLFPDFCKETAMRRAALQKVRLSLIQRGATATVANPAKLKVTYKDKFYVFTEPLAAERFVESLPPES